MTTENPTDGLPSPESIPEAPVASAFSNFAPLPQNAPTVALEQEVLADKDRDRAAVIAQTLTGIDGSTHVLDGPAVNEYIGEQIIKDATPLGADGKPVSNYEKLQHLFMDKLETVATEVRVVEALGSHWSLVGFTEIKGARRRSLLQIAANLMSLWGMTGTVELDLVAMGIRLSSSEFWCDFIGTIFVPHELDGYDAKKLQKLTDPADPESDTWARHYGRELDESISMLGAGGILYAFFSGSEDGLSSLQTFLGNALTVIKG